MKKTLVLVMCLSLASTVAVQADVIDDEKRLEGPKSPHEELRDAVARIRSYYSPDYNMLANYKLARARHHARLGLILGGAWIPGDGEAGAVVVAVTPGSPAAEAGMLAGDVIISFNGEALAGEGDHEGLPSIAASQKLVAMSRELEEGDTVALEYVRDGKTHRVDLVARKIELDPLIVHQPRNKALGVLVVRGPEGDDSLGLESGDVILSIGGREVRSPEHAMRILRSYEPDENLTVQIVRHRRSQTLMGTVPETPIDFDFRFDFRDREPREDR
jgi:S1-C subfamily serine protease